MLFRSLTASGMSVSKGCGGGSVGNLDDEFNLTNGVATNPRIVDTDDRERSEDGLVVSLPIDEGASSVGVLENHDDAWLDSALRSLSLMVERVR